MKIGAQTSTEDTLLGDLLEDVKPSAAAATEERSLLDDVLNEAAQEASGSVEEVTPAVVYDEKVDKFFTSYRVTRSDIGQTPLQIYQDQTHVDRPPSEDEEAILDALIFQGRFEKEFRIGKVTFLLSTFSTQTEQAARRYLQRVYGNDPDGFSAAFNAVVVARALVSIGGRPTCSVDVSDPAWESSEAFEERVGFVSRLPTDLLDGIGSRVNTFLNATSGAVARNLSDF